MAVPGGGACGLLGPCERNHRLVRGELRCELACGGVCEHDDEPGVCGARRGGAARRAAQRARAALRGDGARLHAGRRRVVLVPHDAAVPVAADGRAAHDSGHLRAVLVARVRDMRVLAGPRAAAC